MEELLPRRIVLTGAPRSGKTTIIQRLLTISNGMGLNTGGLLTPEILEHGRRKGFRILDINSGISGILAETNKKPVRKEKWIVGKYHVFAETLRNIAIPALMNILDQNAIDLLFIDEIGKMELLDKDFANIVLDIIRNENLAFSFIVTMGKGIPSEYRKKIELCSVEIYEVAFTTREGITKELSQWVTNYAKFKCRTQD